MDSETKHGRAFLVESCTSSSNGSAPAGRDDALEETVHGHIIPTLIRAHWEPSQACQDAGLPPSEEEIAVLARLAIEQANAQVMEHLLLVATRGLSLETLLLQLVAPAARLLGDQWLSDELTFAEVTVGLGTLQRLAQNMGCLLTQSPTRGLVVLVATPGEQHTLALYLLGELLRMQGWEVRLDPQMHEAALLEQVRTSHVVALGFTASSDALVAALNPLIARAKRASRNRNMVIMAGGKFDPKSLKGAQYIADVRGALQLLDQIEEIKPPAKSSPAERAVPRVARSGRPR